MSQLWMMICGFFGHGETERKWHEYKKHPHILRNSSGEYITSCKRCGMIVRIERSN